MRKSVVERGQRRDYLPDRQTIFEIEEASVNKAEIQLAEALVEIYDILEGKA